MPNSLDRPMIEIEKTRSEWIWDIIGFLFFIGSIIFLLSVWNTLPDQVPTHFNAAGEVDHMGSKWQLLILPGIGIGIALFMKFVEKHPEIHNYPARLNESNAEQFYLQSRKIVNQLKNMILIIFTLILFESVSIALGWGGGFGEWFLPITIVGLGVPIVLGIINQSKIG